MWLPALTPALGVVALTLLLILVLHVGAPQELERLPVRDADMRRFALAGHFPLSFAASLTNRGALAIAAGLQTFACFALVAFSCAYAAWRGFLSSRARGWSDAFWAVGIIVLCAAPSVIKGLTWPTLDYAITASLTETDVALPPFVAAIYGPDGLNSRMLPEILLAERGFVGAVSAVLLAVFSHDLGYRLRETLHEFGYLETDVERPKGGDDARARKSAQDHARRHAGRAHAGRDHAGRERTRTGEGGWDRRHAPPPVDARASEEARARSVLGVGPNASKGDIERAYRGQMKRAHPDRGGSVERAAALNAARDVLLRRG